MKTALLLALFAMTLAGCSTPKKAPPPEEKKVYEVAKHGTSRTSKVMAVDYESRKITLDINNKPVVVYAGDDVKNLDQIKKGDTVVTTYEEALVYSINKEEKRASEMKAKGESWTAKPGEHPAAGSKQEYTATVIVKNIDRNEPSVTLEDVDGVRQTLKVLHPERLKNLQIGDAVDITYTQAVAIKVEKKGGTERKPASKK